jgi:hypothetical protein
METELIEHNFEGMIIMADLMRREIGVDNGRHVEPITVCVSRYYLFGTGSIHLLQKFFSLLLFEGTFTSLNKKIHPLVTITAPAPDPTPDPSIIKQTVTIFKTFYL